jgi:branched-chain amino acid transport system ATP-binding protein
MSAADTPVSADPADPLLRVAGLTLTFGGIQALAGVDLDIWGKGIVGLIGPNGAGKTSLFNCLTGAYRASSGSAVFRGTELLGLRPDRVARLRLSRTFQNYSLISDATVLDNVLLGAHLEVRPSMLGGLFGGRAARRREQAILPEAWALLEQFELASVAHEQAGALSFGSAKRVDLVRALLSKPQLLLLDEPASGLPEAEVGRLSDWLIQIAHRGPLPMVLVEHHMGFVAGTADRLVAMNFGRVIADGKPDDVAADEDVVKAYFGGVL